MLESEPIFTTFLGSLYPYGLILALAVLPAVLLLYSCLKRLYPVHTLSALGLTLTLLPCAFLCARLVYCLANLETILVDLSPSFIPKTWLGGFSLAGAVLGGALGVLVYARCTKQSAARLLDAAVPAGALVLMIGRLAEVFTTQGLGDYVFTEALQVFPLSVPNIYGEYQLPVFFYEACVALVILVLALCSLGKSKDGTVALRALLLLCVTQVLLESLREDEFIRFGFVRFNQLCAVGGMLLPLCLWTRCRGKGFWLRLLGLLVCVGVCIGVEFALDKSDLNIWLLYGSMTAAMAASYGLIASAAKRADGTKQ